MANTVAVRVIETLPLADAGPEGIPYRRALPNRSLAQ